LVLPDIRVLPSVLVFLALQLVTNQSTRAQAHTTADKRPGDWITHRATNDSAYSGATDGADSGAHFTGRYWPSSTTGNHKRASQ
jgi:hypothetical protein